MVRDCPPRGGIRPRTRLSPDKGVNRAQESPHRLKRNYDDRATLVVPVVPPVVVGISRGGREDHKQRGK